MSEKFVIVAWRENRDEELVMYGLRVGYKEYDWTRDVNKVQAFRSRASAESFLKTLNYDWFGMGDRRNAEFLVMPKETFEQLRIEETFEEMGR